MLRTLALRVHVLLLCGSVGADAVCIPITNMCSYKCLGSKNDEGCSEM